MNPRPELNSTQLLPARLFSKHRKARNRQPRQRYAIQNAPHLLPRLRLLPDQPTPPTLPLLQIPIRLQLDAITPHVLLAPSLHADATEQRADPALPPPLADHQRVREAMMVRAELV